MSNALAIAAVSAVLRNLLNNAVIDHGVSATVGSPVTVTALPPDRITIGDSEQPQLNIFLYHVSTNSGWSNSALPSRDTQGNRVTNPPLALDLYYLLSAYGKHDFDGEILLGCAMQTFHEIPVLPRDTIRSALASLPSALGSPSPNGPLATADLAEQVELIKITPQLVSTEEVWRLWTALQAHYRPTAAYRISVVLIQSNRIAKAALPVSRRNIFTLPFRQPFIEQVTPQMVVVGAPLTLSGQNFKAAQTKIAFGSTPLVDPTSITENQVTAIPPPGLLAGINTIQIVQPLTFGTPADPHSGFESNVAPFMLAPQITTAPPLTIKTGTTLTLGIRPPVGRAQDARLIIGERSITIPVRPANGPATTTSVDFPIPAGFPTGDFPLRVQIDGAPSPLEIDQNPNSPTFGQLTGNPKITVTT
jgi:Pvc16 N-terminal domain/IPT/TIG domain